MSDARRREADRIFGLALDAPPEARDALVRREAAGDTELEKLVRRLLAHVNDETVEGIAEAGALAGSLGERIEASVSARDDDLRGVVLGAFRVREQIGQGGMSIVHAAERADGEFQQRVAIKVLKRGLDTDELVARFRVEREILGRLDHPGIAAIIDGGSTPDGRPYFVMELVDGRPIDEHSDTAQLTIEERLRLFAEAGAAVAAAHRNLVVHRDIKPSNVLVDREGRVRLLDFGIAKMLAEGEDRNLTGTSVRPMTPAFASPEQVRGASITTATDVYQLGALLYLLLTGRTPHDETHASDGAWMRAVLDKSPPRPRDAVTRLAGGVEDRARVCSETPIALERHLKGDLEAIVMKALAKSPADRYTSVAQMIDDVERYLAGRPVSARPYSFFYRSGLFIRRNRLPVGLAAVAAILLAGFSVTTALQSTRIAEERDRANRQAEASQRAARFLSSLLAATDPDARPGEPISVLDLLDRGKARLDAELGEYPLVRAEIARTMGAVYQKLGRAADALELYQESYDARVAELGPAHPDTLRSSLALGSMLSNVGRHDEARALLEQTIEHGEKVHGPDHDETIGAKNNLALIFWNRGEYDTAEALMRQTLDARQRTLGPDHVDTLQSITNLANLRNAVGHPQEAERMLRDARQRYARLLGEDDRRTLETRYNLASVLSSLGRTDEAIEEMEGVAEISTQVFGESHPTTLHAFYGLSRHLSRAGRLDEAVVHAERCLQRRTELLGPSHPHTMETLELLGTIERLRERLPAARSHFATLVATSNEHLPASHPMSVRSSFNLAAIESLMGEHDAALERLRSVVETGFGGPSVLDDPDLANLHGDPRFEALRQRARAISESSAGRD